MVAEPVQATVETLNYLYEKSLNFVSNSKDYVSKSDYFDKVLDLNPFGASSHTQESIYTKSIGRDRYPNSIWNRMSNAFSKKERVVLYSTVFTIGIGITSVYVYQRATGKSIFGRSGGLGQIGAGGGSKNGDNASNGTIKRRVPKLYNGARRDVILVIGSPTEPLTRLMALDFEKRGFIVYLTILDTKDLKYVESNPITDDINYLNLNDSYSFDIQLIKFQAFLEAPVVPFPGAQPHQLRLKGCVFAPSLYFPIGPVENITVASWLKILERFQIVLKLLSSGLISLVRKQQPFCKVIVITSNILSSLNLPYHAPETFYQKSVQNLFTSLTREISQHRISVTQVKLGNLNISTNTSTAKSQTPASASKYSTASLINSEVRNWDDDMKELYGDSFFRSQYRSNPIRTYSSGRGGAVLGVFGSSVRNGSNLRDLYHQLFDLLYPANENKMNPSVVYCGTGARAYDWISSFLSESVLNWLLT